jgi:hypothetical protein
VVGWWTSGEDMRCCAAMSAATAVLVLPSPSLFNKPTKQPGWRFTAVKADTCSKCAPERWVITQLPEVHCSCVSWLA